MKKFLNRLAAKIGFVPANSKRGFDMGKIDRLTMDWIGLPVSDGNREMRYDLDISRERSRDLERNDDYVLRYLKLCENNVLGHCGIGLQMKITETVKQDGKFVSRYDDLANGIIEDSWAKWGRKEFCTATSAHSWLDVQRLMLRSTVRDGSAISRDHIGGPFGYAVEPLEGDYLDHKLIARGTNGNEILLGQEFNKQKQVVAYWLWTQHPGNFQSGMITQTERIPVPASQIIYLYRPNRLHNPTGMPWMHSAARGLKMVGGYREAELVAARAGACKMAFVESDRQTEYTGVNSENQQETTPGIIEKLAPGQKMVEYDPTHPNSNYGGFIKDNLRGIAAGLGVSYVSLANDLEGVNYSSIRAGLLDEREEWKAIQQWFIEWYIQPVFERWLKNALAVGAITNGVVTLPLSKFDKFNKPEWKPRRWDWVDPYKDMQANVLAVEKGFKSRQSIIADGGGDVENVFSEQEADNALAKEKGLEFPTDKQAVADAKAPPPEE